MVTGIFELILAYQTVQPLITGQIKLIKDTYSMVMKIRELVNEYKARFLSHRKLVLDLDHQFLRLNVLSRAMEHLCSGNSLGDANRVYLDGKLKSLQSDLEGLENKLRMFLERMTSDNEKLWGEPETKKSKSKKFHAAFDFVLEGKEQLQAALDMSKSWIRSITSEFTFMLIMDSHKVLVGNNGPRRREMTAADMVKAKDKTNYYMSFRSLNIDNITVDIPITRHIKRIMIARAKAQALDNLTRDELEARLVSENELNSTTDIDILENDADLVYGRKLQVVRGTANNFQYHLVDSRPFEDDYTYEQSLRETLFLATLLSSDDNRTDKYESHMSSLDQDIGRLPKCVGVIKRYNDNPQRFDVIYELPPNTHPRVRTLRRALTDPAAANNPIDDRYSLALHLAQSLFLIHSAGLIHRQIRPECVLLTDNLSDKPEDKYPNRLGRPFLFGFGQTREDDDELMKQPAADANPYRVLVYRSPRQQENESTEPKYCRLLDDIYSLGVTLLEIGLWKSLFKVQPQLSNPTAFTYTSDPTVLKLPSHPTTHPSLLTKLLHKASKDVPRKLGTAYTKVVITCLTCLSPESEFGDINQTPGELMRTYERIVLEALREIIHRTSIGY